MGRSATTALTLSCTLAALLSACGGTGGAASGPSAPSGGAGWQFVARGSIPSAGSPDERDVAELAEDAGAAAALLGRLRLPPTAAPAADQPDRRLLAVRAAAAPDTAFTLTVTDVRLVGRRLQVDARLDRPQDVSGGMSFVLPYVIGTVPRTLADRATDGVAVTVERPPG